MSAPASSTVRQERDRIAAAPVYAAAFAVAFILVSGALFTWLSKRHVPVHVGERRDASALVEVPHEINMIDQTLFSAHLPSRGNWDAKHRSLNSYSWVDRDRRVARIPIAQAMHMLVERGHVD